MSHDLEFATVEHLKDRSVQQLVAEINHSKDTYAGQGFTVIESQGDHEFEAT
jgi:hypothetical protein